MMPQRRKPYFFRIFCITRLSWWVSTRILLHRSANLALSAKYSFAIESFVLNPSPPVLLCEQENPLPMERTVVQFMRYTCGVLLYVYITFTLWLTHCIFHLPSDCIICFDCTFCILSAFICLLTAFSAFCLHTAFQFSCCWLVIKALKTSMSFVEWCEVVCPLQSGVHLKKLLCGAAYRNIMLWVDCSIEVVLCHHIFSFFTTA